MYIQVYSYYTVLGAAIKCKKIQLKTVNLITVIPLYCVHFLVVSYICSVKDVPVLLLRNAAAVLHTTLEKVARYFQTFMQAQILLFRCHELEKKISKLNVKMNSEVIYCNYLSQ